MGEHAVRAASRPAALRQRGRTRRVSGGRSGRERAAGEHTTFAAGRRRRGVQRRTGGRVAQLSELPFFAVGPALEAGDFGLSRLRYDSPSITRS